MPPADTPRYSRFKPEDIQPFSAELIDTILTKLESAGSPEKVAENDFMMKCKRKPDRSLNLSLTSYFTLSFKVL